ncbi:MAG: PIN domain-containing protein, partial [Methanosarcinales archaeon]
MLNTLNNMIHLFIDTNRYLALYGFQKEWLEEIEKLITSIRENKVTLWLPEQVKNEFGRNREDRLSGEYKKIEKLIHKIDNFESPNIPESKDELNKIRQVHNTINDNKAEINSIVEDIKKKFEIKIKDGSFLADKIINNLFSSARFIPYDETVIKKAFRRSDLGNPPG